VACGAVEETNVPPDFTAACFVESIDMSGKMDWLRHAEKGQLNGEGGEHESMRA